VKSQPDQTDFVLGLGISSSNMGEFFRLRSEPEAACGWFERGISELKRLLERVPSHAAAQEELAKAFRGRATALTDLNQCSAALASWAEAIRYGTADARELYRLQRAETLARLRDHRVASREALELAAGNAPPAGSLYLAARVFGWAAGVVKADQTLSERERAEMADHYANQSLALLARVQEAGYFRATDHWRDLAQNRAFDSFRSRREFQRLAGDLALPDDPFAN
jgi:hypothetical protein